VIRAPIKAAVAVLCLLALSVMPSGADDFFSGRNSDFFAPRLHAPEAPLETSRTYYPLYFEAGIQSVGIGRPSIAGIGVEWSPFRHFGLGLNVGLLFDGLGEFGGPADERWDYYDDYIDIADNSDWSAYREIYQIAYYGKLPVLSLDLGMSYYFGRNGLKGLFIGNEFGVYVLTAGPDYYFDWIYEVPIKSVAGGDPSLPLKQRFSIKLTPCIGYKLMFAGLVLESKLGYALTSLGTGNGYSIFVSAGFALGRE